MRSPETERMWRLAGKYSSVGVEIAAQVGLGTLGGWWLDDWLDTRPLLFWVGLGFGVFAAGRTIYRLAKTTKLSNL